MVLRGPTAWESRSSPGLIDVKGSITQSCGRAFCFLDLWVQVRKKMQRHTGSASGVGIHFLEVAWSRQDECERSSLERLPGLGDNCSTTLEQLGRVLELLDLMASCYWGCHGREHTIEHLVGRTVSYALAASRLINMGHYDEALSLVRSIAELGNIMSLFMAVPETMREWNDLPEPKRREVFSPVAVRCRLESRGAAFLTGQDEYKFLCEAGVHPHPTRTTQFLER